MNSYKMLLVLALCSVQILHAGKSVFSCLDVNQTKLTLTQTKDIEESMINVANKRKNYSHEDALKTYNKAKSLVASIESINTIAVDALKQNPNNSLTHKRAKKLRNYVNEESKSAVKSLIKSEERCLDMLIEPNSPPLNIGEEDDEEQTEHVDESDDE